MYVKSKGLTLHIDYDESPMHPRRDCDNLGKMYCWHKRYDLGDENPYPTSQDFWNDKKLQKDIFVMKPIYFYDHSGITISSASFMCPWDSGTLGLIYATKTDVLNEYGNLSKETKEEVTKILADEIQVYDDYLTSDYYYFTIEDEEGEVIESSGSYYADSIDQVLKVMKENANKEYGFLFDKMMENQNHSEMY